MNLAPANLFTTHDRAWRGNRYVYPVISRRSGGLSIGINLNPDKFCNFDCIYCCVDRTKPAPLSSVDLKILRSELDEMLRLARSGEIFSIEPFDQTPTHLQRLNDVAFSGDGEPTASACFPQACELVAAALAGSSCKIILITNATLLHQSSIAQALEFLHQHNGEVWAKLDAGTEQHYRRIARTAVPLWRVLENILTVGRRYPIVIQTLLMRVQGEPPRPAEIDAIIERLRDLRDQGCMIKLVQIYTVARRTAESYVSPLPEADLRLVAQKIRAHGLPAKSFC